MSGFTVTELLRSLVLVGPPGAGKSSAGRLVAVRAGMPFVDLDERVRQRRGHSAADLLRREGELSLRMSELRALQEVLEEEAPAIIAGGSGLVTTAEARQLLEARTRVLLLDVSAAEGVRRCLLDDAPRPLLEGDGDGSREDRYQTLVAQRQPLWRELARERLDTSGRALNDVAERLFALVTQPEAPLFPLPDAPPEARFVSSAPHPLSSTPAPALFIVDDGIPESSALRELLEAHGEGPVLRVPGGERCKTLAHAERLYTQLVDARLPPSGRIVAAGGGALLDLVGFVAATLYRGVAWTAVPTTLLAMVDAGLGGKTALNLPAGKNLVGAFHAAQAMVIDPRFLLTLPERDRRAGAVEALKHALLAGDAKADGACARADEALPRLADGQASDADVTRLVRRSLAIKRAVTTTDPYERGLRKVLNLGHTLGHALEHASALHEAPLRHGEAVAAGLRFALTLSTLRCGLDERVAARLLARVQELGVPPPAAISGASFAVNDLLERMRVDKKRRGRELRFIALAAPGRPVVVTDVSDDLLRRCIERAL